MCGAPQNPITYKDMTRGPGVTESFVKIRSEKRYSYYKILT